jgi:hypothetical protein
MNLLKNWWISTKQMLSFTKTTTANTEPKQKQASTQPAGQFSKFYDINDIPLKNFEKCINGQYEYMTKDETLHDESQVRFMEIYFKYIEQVGGGGNWAMIHREYADLKIRSILLAFSQELIIKGMYDKSYCKQQMEQYDYTLPPGNELPMIDSYLASLQLSLDSVSKQIRNLNKSESKNQTLVSILTQINNVNKVYLPYNSILLIEFIEQLKALKEQQKQIKNGRLNK